MLALKTSSIGNDESRSNSSSNNSNSNNNNNDNGGIDSSSSSIATKKEPTVKKGKRDSQVTAAMQKKVDEMPDAILNGDDEVEDEENIGHLMAPLTSAFSSIHGTDGSTTKGTQYIRMCVKQTRKKSESLFMHFIHSSS